MTTNSYSPAPIYTISGIGPYDVPHDYASSDEIRVSIVINDIAVALDQVDYSVVPTGPATSGTVFLTAGAATSYDGETLVIARSSEVEQSWISLSSTAVGLEAQLDQMTRAIQEIQVENARSLRVLNAPVAPYEPQDGCVPYWDNTLASFANGLNYSDLLAGIEAANLASDRADIALHALNGGKWRTDAPTLFADVDLTYAPGQTNSVVEGTKIITQLENFGYSVAASVATDHHVTTAGGVKLYVLPGTDGATNIRAFGATGIAGDDQDSALVTAASVTDPVFFPAGTYDFSTNLVPSSRWTGVNQDDAVLRFSGSGLAVETDAGFENFKLQSMAAGQSGIRITFGVGDRYGPCRIYDFDTIGVEIGVSGVNAAYFLDIGSFEINNQARDGQIGFRIVGNTLPNSNANAIDCPFVKGRWKRYVDIEGNANILTGGDVEPYNSNVAGGIDEVVRISGTGNVWETPYIEPVGATAPAVMFRFESTANSNLIRHTYAPSWGGKAFASIVDAGIGNEVDVRPTGQNFAPSVGVIRSSQNLIPNAGFVNIDPADNMPVGWNKSVTGSSTVVREDTHTRGADHALKLACTGDGRAVAETWIATTNWGARMPHSVFPAQKLRGKTVTFGAWCWSQTADFGAVVLNNGATSYGIAAHSGSGTWEFLTIQARIADAAGEFSIQLRSNYIDAPSTGECWFSEPVLVFGAEIPQVPEFKPLADVEAFMAGRMVQNPPIQFADGDSTPDVSEGNVFTTANTAATTITGFDGAPLNRGGQEITVIPTDANTTIQVSSNLRLKSGTRLLPQYTPVKFVYLQQFLKWFEI